MEVASAFASPLIAAFKGYEKSDDDSLQNGEPQERPPKREPTIARVKRRGGRKLLERVRKQQSAVWRFAVEPAVACTTTQAASEWRASKSKQKRNRGFRASSGTASYSRSNSFSLSLRKLKRELLREVLSVIKGNTFEIVQT